MFSFLLFIGFGCQKSTLLQRTSLRDNATQLQAEIQSLKPDLEKRFPIGSIIVHDSNTVSVAMPYDAKKNKKAIEEFIQSKTKAKVKVTFALE